MTPHPTPRSPIPQVATMLAVDGRIAQACLTAAERTACARMVSDENRSNWRAGRLAAKLAALSVMGDRRLDRFEVHSGTGAPPELAVLDPDGTSRRLDVSLSISHCAGRGAAALAPSGWRVGVDLERARTIPDHFGQYFLGSSELQWACGDLTVLWCLKEAVWKAMGLGHDVRFRSVELGRVVDGAPIGVRIGGAFVRVTARAHRPWPGFVLATAYAREVAS